MSRRFPLCLLLIACGCSGEWKPTGDGKTIVHTRTGEVRVTSTAEPVEEYNERRKAEAAVQAAESKQEQQRLEGEAAARAAESTRERQRREAERLKKDQAREARAMEAEIVAKEQQRATALSNGRNYHAIQLLVCSMPRSEVQENYGSWWFDTKPFRLDQFPTRSERDELVKLVERLIPGSHISKDKEKWSALYDHLKSLEFDDQGRGEILRTAEQLAESAVALKAAADREAKSLKALERRLADERAAGEKAFDEDQTRQQQAREKWLMLKAGLSKADVTAILGSPNRTTLREWTWTYSVMVIPDPDYTVEEHGGVVFDSSGRVADWMPPKWHLQNNE